MSIANSKLLYFIVLIFMTSGSIVFCEEKNLKEINTLLQDEQAELKVLRNKIKKQERAISSFGRASPLL